MCVDFLKFFSNQIFSAYQLLTDIWTFDLSLFDFFLAKHKFFKGDLSKHQHRLEEGFSSRKIIFDGKSMSMSTQH